MKHRRKGSASGAARPSALRIVGGRLGGRKILYHGDPHVRPMKDRTREAVFNLVGPRIREKHALDLFGGTGTMALESISRDAASATIIERHFPSARVIQQNVQSLGVGDAVHLVMADVFHWLSQHPQLPMTPWVVFCCPPYRFYQERLDDMVVLIRNLFRRAPQESIFVVEADDTFDFSLLPSPDRWDVRTYIPARIGILVVE